MTTGNSMKKPNGRKRAFPLSISLALLALAIGAVAAVFMNKGSFSIALGDALMIEALVMAGLAWVGYLRKDGIRFFPQRKARHAGSADSWKDRIPSLGDSPLPAQPIPGESGPDSAEYRRLAAAEVELRKKIIGLDPENKPNEGETLDQGNFARQAGFAALFLFLLALGFEYLAPRLFG